MREKGYIAMQEKHLKTKDFYKRQLPRVGDRMLMQVNQSEFLEKPTWAEVIFVNEEAMFYTVKYMGIGMTETISPVIGSKYLNQDTRHNGMKDPAQTERKRQYREKKKKKK